MNGNYDFLKNKDFKMEERIEKYFKRMKEGDENYDKMNEDERTAFKEELGKEHFKLVKESSEY